MATYPEFKSPLRNVWQYLNRNLPYFKKALGITRDYVAETGSFAVSNLNKVENYSITTQGTELDIYNFQAQTQLSGSNTYAIPIGFITTSSTTTSVASSKSVVLADDTIFNTVVTPLGVSALVTDSSTGDVIPVSFMAINIDNTITTPDEYYIFLVAGDALNFECTVVIDIEIAVVKGSTVEYTTI